MKLKYFCHEAMNASNKRANIKLQIIRLIWPFIALSSRYQVLSKHAQIENSGWHVANGWCSNPTVGGEMLIKV
jgi:hypothetical protein